MVDAAVMTLSDMDDLLAVLWANDVPASKVEDRSQLHEHPQVEANASIRVLDDPLGGPIRQSAPGFDV